MQLMPMAFIPFILFTNFLVSLEQIPAWIRWLQWLNPFKFMVDCMAITEYDGKLEGYECMENQSTGEEFCDYLYDGPAYLDQIGAGYLDTYWLKDFITTYKQSAYVDWILLFVLLVAFRFITWLILVKRNGW